MNSIKKNQVKKALSVLLFILCFITNVTAQTPHLIGTTAYGGTGAGSVFGIQTGGNNILFKNTLGYVEGANPNYSSLVEMPNGLFYGMTMNGGTNNTGIIFEYNPYDNTCTKKIDFVGTNGSYPYGSLFKASNGKLYGVTSQGGANFSVGVLFEYDPLTNVLIKKVDFEMQFKGGYPYGTLIEDSNGVLWGTTSGGGSNNAGIIFQYDPVANTFMNKANFQATSTGYESYGELTFAPNGKIYGITEKGGSFDKGVLFEFNPSTNALVTKAVFVGTNGANPRGTLLLEGGKLYGVTAKGGLNTYGTLFEYDYTNNMLTTHHNFYSTNIEGAYPYTKLTKAANGMLYGTAYSGGLNNKGIIFQFDPLNNTYTKKIDMGSSSFAGTNPVGNMILASSGKLIGMTKLGGKGNKGVFYEYDPATNNIAKKFEFSSPVNGINPFAGLTKSSNGKIYGVMNSGGNSNYGIIYEYDASTNSYSKILDLPGGVSGSDPKSALLEATNGKYYGLTTIGGLNAQGVLYEFDPTAQTYLKKVEFDGTNGSNPNGSLIQATNGKFYGMTVAGGSNSMGVIFEYDLSSNTLTKKVDFDGASLGASPFGSLIQLSNGKLYGMTKAGGSNDLGVLFEYDLTSNVLTKKIDFDGTNTGSSPKGSLFSANNGKLYGLTENGGTYDLGVLFEYDPALNVLTKKTDFSGITNGRFPLGTLMQASNSKLYGTTSYGGLSNMGTVFEYDITSGVLVKKIDLNETSGKYPQFGQLIEVSIVPLSVKENIFSNNIKIYPNPTRGNFIISSDENIKSINIRNIMGQIIYDQTSVGSSMVEVMLNDFPDGIYFISVLSEKGGSSTSKIIKRN
ncbi:MAG: C-terminal target protein [Bacteroidetes bacterium]|jgi:uncharacterized repeat protein (TIGR03803 family)|nr:C-terminal target protein [Bacteroidota bacterium]